MSAPILEDVEYHVAYPNGLIRYKVNSKSIVFRNAPVLMSCLEDDLQVSFTTLKNEKSYVYPTQIITKNSAGMATTLSTKIIIMLEHHTLELADVESKKPYCTLVPKVYPPGDLEYHHLLEETIQEHNALFRLMQKLMEEMIPKNAEGQYYKKMPFKTIQDFKIKLNFQIPKGTDKTQQSEFNNLLAVTASNTHARKRLALQVMGGWILPPEISTQDVDDLRWNTVGVSFQVYPWACTPMGKPRPARPSRSLKRKAEGELEEKKEEGVPATPAPTPEVTKEEAVKDTQS